MCYDGGMVEHYTCPMHPEVHSDKPGLCPECGMKLLSVKAGKNDTRSHEHHHQTQAGFDKHAGHSTNIFRAKFWWSLALSIPVVAYSDISATLFGWQAPAF